MTEHFNALITYSPKWHDTGEEYTQKEGFQNMDFLTDYLRVMDWRIIRHEIIR
jgi:hypothetical protein